MRMRVDWVRGEDARRWNKVTLGTCGREHLVQPARRMPRSPHRLNSRLTTQS